MCGCGGTSPSPGHPTVCPPKLITPDIEHFGGRRDVSTSTDCHRWRRHVPAAPNFELQHFHFPHTHLTTLEFLCRPLRRASVVWGALSSLSLGGPCAGCLGWPSGGEPWPLSMLWGCSASGAPHCPTFSML